MEHTGLIWPLTLEVLDQALRQVRAWHQAGHDVQVAVNLSARCLHRADLASQVADRLACHDVPPRCLRLELTESALMAEPDRALQHLQDLAEAGVRLSVDDFGTGYSSMSYLRRLPVDELKVDRSFVADLATRATDGALVRSVVELGHSLGSPSSPRASSTSPPTPPCGGWAATSGRASTTPARNPPTSSAPGWPPVPRSCRR